MVRGTGARPAQGGFRYGLILASQLKKGDLTVRSPFSFAARIYLANGRLAAFRKAYTDAKKQILGVNGAIAASQSGLAYRF